MERLMTIEEIEKDFHSSGHKRAAMFDSKNQKLVAWNSRSTSVEDRFEEIKKRLGSKSTANGVYQIHGKHWGSDAAPAVYYVAKGELSDPNIEISKPNEVVVSSNIPVQSHTPGMTHEKYNDLYREKLELEVEVKQLKSEIEDLNATISELEASEPEQSGGFLSDKATQDWFSGLAESITPVLDRHFDLKEKKIHLEALKLTQATAPPQQHQQPLNDQEHDDGELTEQEENTLDSMQILQQKDPEAYATLMAQLEQIRNSNPPPQ